MSAELIAAYVTGVVFLGALLWIGCFLAFRQSPNPVPPEAMLIFRVILAIAAAGFGTVLSGFLEINGSILSWQFRAAGSLAIFVAVYFLNPPELIKKRIPRPKSPKKIRIPDDRLD
jgi:hypothetical protein